MKFGKGLLIGSFLTILSCTFLVNLWAAAEAGEKGPLKIFVSIPPQKFFVKALGGDHVAVSVLVGSGQSPHTYEVTPRQMAELGRTDVYFSIGVDFERTWLGKIQAVNPKLKLVAMDQNLKKLKMTVTHAHDNKSHSGFSDSDKNQEGDDQARSDPHVWLSPSLVKEMALVIFETLTDALPEYTNDFQANLKAFQTEMTNLDMELNNILKSLKNRSFLVYHPAWGYFAHEYGLTQVAIEIEGKEPGAKSLHKVIQEVKEKGSKVIFVQRGFSPRSASAVARATGGRVVFLDSMAEDYINNMKKTAEALLEGQK
ncbi:MAG: zinc ABC transporter substrate-binding protein [Deltaproteobacteria bacterium]|nr:zinc ABC transporter substrate-binding protein [Deltaproteobacteria bacterium]MBW2322480.1 zinc ABC transporter substrate-binding protein [Deltaproteobacteria bacterium]